MCAGYDMSPEVLSRGVLNKTQAMYTEIHHIMSPESFLTSTVTDVLAFLITFRLPKAANYPLFAIYFVWGANCKVLTRAETHLMGAREGEREGGDALIT